MMGFMPPPAQMAPPPPEVIGPIRGRGRGRGGPRGSRGRGIGRGANGPSMGAMHHGSASPPGRNSDTVRLNLFYSLNIDFFQSQGHDARFSNPH